MTVRPAARRAVIIIALLGVLAVAALAYWSSHRTLVVERPSLGGPPPVARRHENLVGRRVPNFSAVDQDGRAAGTDALQGRVLVVNVWATWCRPCIEELPRIEREVWRRFAPRVAVVAVARGDSMEKILAFNRKARLTFSLVADPKQRLARRFGGDDSIPRTYVIDRTGVVVHQTLGYGEENFRELVAAVEQAVSRR